MARWDCLQIFYLLFTAFFTLISLHIVHDIPRCPKNHRKIYCIHFEQEDFVQSTTRFNDVELRIRANLVVNKHRARPQNSKSAGGGNTYIDSSWRQPHLMIELITRNNGESSSTTTTSSKSGTNGVKGYKMTSYFDKLLNGWAVIRVSDVKENWVRHEKMTKMKKIDVKLRIQCHYCYFQEEMSLDYLPFIYVNIVKKNIPKVIPNCDPKTHGCCLEELWLDFSDKDWIYPNRYNIGRCTGQCGNIGFTRESIASKSIKELEHRFILKILSDQNKSRKLCCIPQKFGPMTLLYRNKKNFAYAIKKKTVITQCGCA